jgi:tRNA pseudouridine38-40 synthase
MSFLDYASHFMKGEIDGIFHLETRFIFPDKSVCSGRDAVIAYFAAHPDFFCGMERISPDSQVTLSYRIADGGLIKIFSYDDWIGKIIWFEPSVVRQRIKLTLEYDGTLFAGFQMQKDLRTVQSELTDVLTRINDHSTPVTGASRTDAGVHAFGQVAHFDTNHDFSERKWKIILNHALPADLHVVSVKKVHPLFHARFDVDTKEYQYILNLGDYSALRRNQEWSLEHPIDLAVLESELAKIVGTHDFQSFCKGENESTVRTIYEAKMTVKEDHVILSFKGNGFLHNMIRLLVGSMVAIASGVSTVDMTEILSDRNRIHTKYLAPSGGLYLLRINY